MPSPVSCGGVSRWHAHDRSARRSPGQPVRRAVRRAWRRESVGSASVRSRWRWPRTTPTGRSPDWRPPRTCPWAKRGRCSASSNGVAWRARSAPARTSVASSTIAVDALDWALAIERSRPNPCVTTTRVSTRDHAALLHRLAELVRSSTSPLRRHRSRGRAPAFDREHRAAAHAADPRVRSRGRDLTPSPTGTSRTTTDGERSTTLELWADHRHPRYLRCCDVCGVPSPTRFACGWTSPATTIGTQRWRSGFADAPSTGRDRACRNPMC